MSGEGTAVRVLLIANTLPPRDISGAGEQVLQLAAGLREAGHKVEVLGRGPGGAGGPKVLFALTILRPTWRALRRLRPEVVQVHESDAGLAALLVRLVRPFLRPRPRLVALLQVSYIEEIRSTRALRYGGRVLGRPGAIEKRFRWTKGPLQVALGFLTAQLAERILVPSRRTGDEVERDYRVRDTRVLPNVTGAEIPGRASEPDTGDLPEPGYLLFVGRLRIRKGVEVLLEAMAAMAAPGARLIVVGDGEQRASLEQQASRLELGEAVRFLGRANAARVRRLLAGARCLVVPSTYEGMPLVILEAMRQAVPVVASSVSGIPEVVVDGETGWLVPPEDPPRLAEALAEALHPDEAVRRGKAGEIRVNKLYTPAAAAEIWLREIPSDPQETPP